MRRDGNDFLVSAKVLEVECEKIANLVDVHRCDESSVMNLNTRYPFGDDDSSPFPMSSFAIGDKIKLGLNQTCTFICFRNGKPKSIAAGRSGTNIPEFDQILRRIEKIRTLSG